MKAFIIFAVLFYSCSNKLNIPHKQHDECKSQYDSKLKKNIYETVDEMPEFVGGTDELIKYILKNTVYPNQEIVQGSVKIVLIIDTDGKVRDEKIVNKAIGDYTPLDNEVLRVVQHMPKWRAGKCNKRKVPVRVFIPIRLSR
jgi:protein TonB